MPEKLSLADLTQAVTHIMYYEHSHDLAETWSPREMLDRLGDRASGNLLKIVFGELQAQKIVQFGQSHPGFSSLSERPMTFPWELSLDGFRVVEASYRKHLHDYSLPFDNHYEALVTEEFRNARANAPHRIEIWGLDAESPQMIEVARQRPDGSDVVPAADRFVTLDHNDPLVHDAQKAVANLADEITRSNDLHVTGDERLALVREVEGVQSLLAGKAVRASAIWAAVRENSAISWLSKETGSGVIRALAGAAVLALLALLKLV